MKKIIFILALFVSFVANAQYTAPTGYTYFNTRSVWFTGLFRALGIPSGGSVAWANGQAQMAGAMFYDSTGVDSGLYVWTGTYWRNHSSGGFFSPDQTSTGNTTHDANGNDFMINNINQLSLNSENTNLVANSDFTISGDSVRMNSTSGRINIPNLIAATDTIPKPVARYSDGRVVQMDYWPGSGGSGGAVEEVSKDFTLSNDSLYNTNWVNVVDFGADPTGVSNSATAFTNAISTGKNIFVPVGTFLITGTAGATPLLALNVGQKIFGTGVNSIIKTTSNARILDITTNCEVKGIKFLGNGNNTTASQYQSGIYAAGVDATGWLVDNCTFEKLGGSTAIDGGGIIIEQIGASYTEGGRITNCRFTDNYYGITLDARAEYINISFIKVNDGNTGIYVGAGNVIVSSVDIQDCVTGFKLAAGANDGHGVVSNSTLNHNTTNLDIDGITLGHTFTGVMIYQGNVIISNSTAIKFGDCDFGTVTATLTNNTDIDRSNCRTSSFSENLISGEGFTIIGAPLPSGISGGQIIYGGTGANEDLVIHGTIHATKTTSAVTIQPSGGQVGIGPTPATTGTSLHVNGLATSSTGETVMRVSVSDAATNYLQFGNGSSTDGRFSPLISGVTAVNAAETPLFFVGEASAATETGTTPLTIFSSRRTGALATTRPLFSFRNFSTSVLEVLANGNVGIGTTSPTAALHLKAGTTAASTAPLKFTSGTNLTTPENGAVEYDGTHFYGTVGGVRYQLDQQSGSGVTTLGAIGSTPNANGATITGSTLNLEPASATFGGIVTTGTQSFAGTKSFGLISATGISTSGYYGAAETGSISTPGSGIGFFWAKTDGTPNYTNDDGLAVTLVGKKTNSEASTATPTPTGDAFQNIYNLTALATNATFAAPSGTPVDGNIIWMTIKDDGTSRTLGWNAIYDEGSDVALPTATVVGEEMELQLRYRGTTSKWRIIGKTGGF